ncbi:hypothetical protein Tco_0578532, partial [Tanacetum coccineum]
METADETKVKTILLQSLPEDHMADFHHLDDARDIWLAVKARFGGNDESKKMRKSMLKQEFSEFRVSESEGLHKGYDRFQKILSQLNQMQAKPDNEDCNMNFDDLYNKLRTFEIDVKGGSSYDSRGTSAPTHLAFISAARTNSKMSYPDQSHSTTFTSASSSLAASSNVIENVLHSFVAESDPQQQITYEYFDQIGKLDLEELDIKWQMAMLSDEGEDVENGAGGGDAQVYGLFAGAEDDAAGRFTGDATGDVADDVSNAAAEFALMGISSQVKLEESNARFDKWKESSKNLVKLINSSMSSRSKFGLGFGDTFGSDEVFDLSAPSIFDSSPKDVAEKPLYDRFVKAVGMHDVPPPITGNISASFQQVDLDDTQVTYGLKSNNYFETNSVSNDLISCDNSDKSSDSENTGFASCVSSVKSSSSKTNEPLASASSSVDFKTVSETADLQPSSTNDDSSFSFKENKFHLIKDYDFYKKQLELNNKPMWTNVANIPSFIPKAASVPAGSRNRQTSVPAGSRNRQTSVHAGSRNGTTSVPAGSRNRQTFVTAGSRNGTTSVPAGSRNRPTSVPAGRSFSA